MPRPKHGVSRCPGGLVNLDPNPPSTGQDSVYLFGSRLLGMAGSSAVGLSPKGFWFGDADAGGAHWPSAGAGHYMTGLKKTGWPTKVDDKGDLF